jgi:Zn ribbon nucleic-acid-binding protein
MNNQCPRCNSKSYTKMYAHEERKCMACSYQGTSIPADIQKEVSNAMGKNVIARKDFRYKWD